MERHADAEAGGHVVDHADEEVGQHQTHPLPVMLDRDACSSIRLILRKLFILTYLIGTFGLAFPNLAVKTKPWAATKRNEENVTRWPMPGSCLRDHSCLTPALGKDSNCWRLTHLLDHALEDQHVGGARREGQQYRRSHCHLGDLFLDDFSLPRLTRLSWRSRPYWLDLTSQCFGDAGRRKYRWRVVAFE